MGIGFALAIAIVNWAGNKIGCPNCHGSATLLIAHQGYRQTIDAYWCGAFAVAYFKWNTGWQAKVAAAVTNGYNQIVFALGQVFDGYGKRTISVVLGCPAGGIVHDEIPTDDLVGRNHQLWNFQINLGRTIVAALESNGHISQTIGAARRKYVQLWAGNHGQLSIFYLDDLGVHETVVVIIRCIA